MYVISHITRHVQKVDASHVGR